MGALLTTVGVSALYDPLAAYRPPHTVPSVGENDPRLVYLRDCATCHGANGHGTSRGPTLEGAGPASVDLVLTTGRMPMSDPTDQMKRHEPAYPAPLIAALVSYVSELVPGGPQVPSVDLANADLARGGAIYREQCAACHQAAGQGGVLVGQESPSLQRSTPVQVAEAMRTGLGTMPVFGPAAVSERDLNGVAAYVGELQHPSDPGGEALWHLGPIAEGAAALAALGVVAFVLRLIGSRT
jgi:ubiquinol-cytochrome c reductase cytochrome c subunit